MSRIGLIDADLLDRPNHRFPNLALMKISGYHKALGDHVSLISYDSIAPNAFIQETFDKIYLSKVFTETAVPEYVLQIPGVEYGGTGFFFDKAPRLPDEIEHHFPDYHLYDTLIKNEMRVKGRKKKWYRYYTDYSIGFTTRGCFRHCEFCVNRNENRVYVHSPVSEFLDPSRKKICLLDDNVFGTAKWEDIFNSLISTGKSFMYNQGLDIRLLTKKKAEVLARSRYDSFMTFAFDNYEDREIIIKKIQIFKEQMPLVIPRFYVLVGFDREGKWDDTFWVRDIIELFERLKILMKYRCVPYLMRFYKWQDSPQPFREIYESIVSFGAPIIFKKQTFFDYKTTKGVLAFAKKYPEIADKYFNMRYGEIND
jgi:hypothetical protein